MQRNSEEKDKKIIISSPGDLSSLKLKSPIIPLIENYDTIQKHQNYKSYSPDVYVEMPHGYNYKITNGSNSKSSINSSEISSYSSSEDNEDSDGKISIRSFTSNRKERKQRRDKRERKERKEKKEKRNTPTNYDDPIIQMLIDDYVNRKKIEKEKELSKTETQNSTQSIPSIKKIEIINEKGIKKKIPNYDLFSAENKQIAIEKFRNSYNKLKMMYPMWDIEIPNYQNTPLRIIHEQYEQNIKTICSYQTAMKFKVYLIILIAGIEYYGFNVKGYTPLEGLLKSQIKTIHKFNNYLVEFAEQFYSDEEGEEWPAWMRFLFTIITGLGCFSTINGLTQYMGMKETPEFILENADKFISPSEVNVKLHSDGISEVPETQTGFQDPDTIIGLIGSAFNAFTGNAKDKEVKFEGKEVKTEDDDYSNISF
jgi:hypothetical protein